MQQKLAGPRGGALTPSFASKLNRLFDECRAPDGRRFANTEVVEAINLTGQATISPSYLSELLSGKKDNPSIWTVKALADFFGQPLDYFVEQDLPPRRPQALGQFSPEAGTDWTLAARLNLLFTMAERNGNSSPTNAQVAAAAAATGVELSGQTLAAVRAGDDVDLSTEVLRAIAAYFEVPVAVLTDERVADMLAAQLPAMQLLQNDTVRKIAYRAYALSEEDRSIVTGLLDRLAREDPGISPNELEF